MSMEMKTQKQEEIRSAVGISLLLNKNNGTWLFKRVQEKNHERCFNAVRNWLSFRDNSETEEWEWYNGKPWKLRADVEKSRADELMLLEQTDESKTKDALTEN